MRARFLIVAITSVVSALAIASCSEGGTGVGTAPGTPRPCPQGTPADPMPAAGAGCTHLQVCSYPKCTSSTCPSTQTVAYCPGPGGTWQISVAGDGGGFTDAEVPEISIDAGGDGGDAGEASTDAPSTDAADDAEEASVDAPDAD